MSPALRVRKIVSGGQTGADRGGLLAGRRLGLETGGWAPRGWQTESGPAEAQLRALGLVEHPEPGYPPRTRANVRDSDGTVLFVDRRSTPGSRLTRRCAAEEGRPLIEIPACSNPARLFETPAGWQRKLRAWLAKHRIEVLNVAGNRESVALGIAEEVAAFLVEALTPGG